MEGEGLNTAEQLKLHLASAFYSLRSTLRLSKLRYLLSSASISPDSPVWLLGERYGYGAEGALPEQALARLLEHFHSIIWMTYRTAFTPIAAGDALLRSDAGWGCTLRSGQMVVAQALQRHWLGRGWRWPAGSGGSVGGVPGPEGGGGGASAAAAAEEEEEPPRDLCWLLHLFWDAPSERNPLSIHNLCTYGRPCGVHPGKWLGPWVMCRALEAAAAHAQQALGVRVAVIAEPGGGAPMLSIARFEPHFAAGGAGGSSGSSGGGEAGQERRPAAGSEAPPGPAHPEGMLLLVPLVLGLGKLNPVYVPQLQAALRFPQSVGIVGGRPASSLYFVGYQGDRVLYLDPHEMQPAACSDGDWRSFRCDALRSMPLLSIDPSLALGFYCRDLGEYHDLCERLADLERRSGGAPLLCVTAADVPPAREYDAEGAAWVPDEMSEEGEEGEEAVGELGGAAVAGKPAAGVPEGGGAAGSPPQAAAAAGPEEATGPGSPGAGARGQPAAVSPPARQASGRGGWELL